MANFHPNELAPILSGDPTTARQPADAELDSALSAMDRAELDLIAALDELAGTLRTAVAELEGSSVPVDTLQGLERTAHELDLTTYGMRAGSSMAEPCGMCGGDVHGGNCDTRDPSDA